MIIYSMYISIHKMGLRCYAVLREQIRMEERSFAWLAIAGNMVMLGDEGCYHILIIHDYLNVG